MDLTALNNTAITLIDGTSTTLGQWGGQVRLIVNVASRCGLSPQYAQLEELQEYYGPKGFTVLGCPSNQFLQELSSEEKIVDYCTENWGVTFPMTARLRVNGRAQHPLYELLTTIKDDNGKAGRVKWNFEKFLIAPTGESYRFRPTVQPTDRVITSVIERHLPQQ